MTITYTGVDPEHHVGWGNSKILKIAYFSFVLAHAPQNFVFNRYFCAISSFWEKKFPTFLALDHLMRTELCYYVLYLDVYWIHKGFELYLAFAPRTIQYFPCVYSFLQLSFNIRVGLLIIIFHQQTIIIEFQTAMDTPVKKRNIAGGTITT